MILSKKELLMLLYESSIMKEKVAHPRGSGAVSTGELEFPVVVSYKGSSEIAYDQSELDDILDDIAPVLGDDPGIPYALDALADVEAEDMPVGLEIEQYGEGMKISKRRLQAIIKEEKAKILREQSDNPYLDALASVTESSNACLETLELASRDIGPLDKALYDKIDEALVMLEDLGMLAEKALENADQNQKMSAQEYADFRSR